MDDQQYIREAVELGQCHQFFLLEGDLYAPLDNLPQLLIDALAMQLADQVNKLDGIHLTLVGNAAEIWQRSPTETYEGEPISFPLAYTDAEGRAGMNIIKAVVDSKVLSTEGEVT